MITVADREAAARLLRLSAARIEATGRNDGNDRLVAHAAALCEIADEVLAGPVTA